MLVICDRFIDVALLLVELAEELERVVAERIIFGALFEHRDGLVALFGDLECVCQLRAKLFERTGVGFRAQLQRAR
jgi:hypothetical protein